MRKMYLVLVILTVLSVGTVVGLHLTGYLLNDQRIIPPQSTIDWEHGEENPTENTSTGWTDTNESNHTTDQFPLLVNLTETMKDVPGIEYVKYEIFVTNETMNQVIAYYKDILEADGYAYHDEYSGMKMYESSEIYYYTFVKGLNGVVVYVSQYHQQTWVCYTTSDIVHYQQIFEYLIDQGILS